MKKEYNTPKIEVVSLESEEIMETAGIGNLSSLNNHEEINWGDTWN